MASTKRCLSKCAKISYTSEGRCLWLNTCDSSVSSFVGCNCLENFRCHCFSYKGVGAASYVKLAALVNLSSADGGRQSGNQKSGCAKFGAGAGPHERAIGKCEPPKMGEKSLAWIGGTEAG